MAENTHEIRCTTPPKKEQENKAAQEPVERLVQKNKLEKTPEKSPRQQELEKRFKGTAWKVTDINTTPVYRPITLIEKVKYDDLSDAAAAAKGIKRTYDEKGKLIKTEIVENDDHEMTLELGGEEFKNKLPKDVKDFMKVMDYLSGPYINIHGVKVAPDGSVDLTKARIRAVDRDYPVEPYIYKQEKYAVTREPTLAYAHDLEDRCRKILAEEGLTQAALTKMEKVAIELYQQQSAINLDGLTRKNAIDRKNKLRNEKFKLANERGREFQEKELREYEKKVETITDNWVKMAKRVLGPSVRKSIEKPRSDDFYNWKYKLIWDVEIMDAEKHDNKFRVYISMNIDDGSMIDFEAERVQKSEGIKAERKNKVDLYDEDWDMFHNKIISKEVLHDVKDRFTTVILPEYLESEEQKQDTQEQGTLERHVSSNSNDEYGGGH